MVTLQYNEKEAQQFWREEGREEGREDGRKEERDTTALDMLRDNLPLDMIMKYSRLTMERIQELGRTHGIAY